MKTKHARASRFVLSAFCLTALLPLPSYGADYWHSKR